MVEKGRTAEAKDVFSTLRKHGWEMYLVKRSFSDSNEGWGINSDNTGEFPIQCRSSHYFRYSAGNESSSGFTATAVRCTSSGRLPNAATAYSITLDVTLVGDTWGGTAGYY